MERQTRANGSTFKATQKWLQQVQKDERLNEYLADLSIKWRFNLSRAPCWGGQFERLIGLFKSTLLSANKQCGVAALVNT